MTHECRRPNCPESFDGMLKYDKHLAEDHDPPWQEIEGYPRSPKQR